MARTGRPREFDMDEVLEKALGVFWEHGYEASSLAQLRAVMGLSSASFYAAFESKAALFDVVVERYLASYGRVVDDIADASGDPRSALECTLRRSAAMQTDQTHPAGCLLVLSAPTGSSAHEDVRKRLLGRRDVVRRNVVACVERGIARGELRADTDVAALATVFDGFLWGLSVEARDGASAADLDASIRYVMAAWDGQLASSDARGVPA